MCWTRRPVMPIHRLRVRSIAEIEVIVEAKDPVAKFTALRNHTHPQAQFLWAIHRDLFHYCAVHLAAIAAIMHVISIWLSLGVRLGARGLSRFGRLRDGASRTEWINADIAAGKSMATTPLPDWVRTVCKSPAQGVHTQEGSYSPVVESMQPRSQLLVYRRQLFPDRW
jgi:3-hydroxyacyl-CoA dehydrogenase